MKFCPNCGKKIEFENTRFCTECGFEYGGPSADNSSANVPLQKESEAVVVKVEKNQGKWSVTRLALGILSMTLFPFITFQSCAVGISNSISDTDSYSGTNGFFLAVLLLAGGIVAVAARNTKGKTAPIITMLIFWFAALFAIGTGDTYPDLPVWGWLSFILGSFFFIVACITKKKK